jgi:hypothetical protein
LFSGKGQKLPQISIQHQASRPQINDLQEEWNLIFKMNHDAFQGLL